MCIGLAGIKCTTFFILKESVHLLLFHAETTWTDLEEIWYKGSGITQASFYPDIPAR